MIRRRSLLAACLLVPFALAGCHHGCHGPRPEHAPAAGPYTNQKRLAAMLSVHAHARFGRDASWPEFRPQPIAQAVAFLIADPDPLAGSRRRRAIAKLAAYRFDEFRPELVALGADIAGIERILHPRYDPKCDAPEGAEGAIATLHANMSAPACPWDGSGFVSPTSQLPTVNVHTTVHVEKPFKAVARAIDSQSWDLCSKFFQPPQQTYIADPGPGGTYPLVDGYAEAQPDPPSAGTTYAKSPKPPLILFEHFAAVDTGFSAIFTNLLWVRGIKTSGTFLAPYGVDDPGRPLTATVNGQAYQLTIDGGYLQATRDPSPGTGTSVEFDKNLAFSDLFASAGTQGLFTAIADELGGELAEMACCATP